MAETEQHKALKVIAREYLRLLGFHAVAEEVACPIVRWRLDVAGFRERPLRVYAPGRPRRTPPEPLIVGIECKQARGDFLGNNRTRDRLDAEARNLERRKRFWERQIRAKEPHLREPGRSLFEEDSAWRYEETRLPIYPRVLQALERLSRERYGQSKFFLMAKYRVADYLLLIAPAGVIPRREVPDGWGLLTVPPEWLRRQVAGEHLPWSLPVGTPGEESWPSLHEGLRVTVQPPRHAMPLRHRERWLHRLAVAASRDAYPWTRLPPEPEAP